MILFSYINFALITIFLSSLVIVIFSDNYKTRSAFVIASIFASAWFGVVGFIYCLNTALQTFLMIIR
jgi:hypothetical protein